MITGLMTAIALLLSGICWVQLADWEQYLNAQKTECPTPTTESPAPGCGRRDG